MILNNGNMSLDLYGVDISYANINIDKIGDVKNADFIIIRAGYGKNHIDDKLFSHLTAIREINPEALIGLYWFSYATSPAEALVECEYLTNVANALKDNIFMLAWDFEYDSYNYAVKQGINPTPTAYAKAILDIYPSMLIYCNKDYHTKYFSNIPLHNLWYAYYHDNAQINCAIHQYSSDKIDKNKIILPINNIYDSMDVYGDIWLTLIHRDPFYYLIHWDDEIGEFELVKNEWKINPETGVWSYVNSKGYAVNGIQRIKYAWYAFDKFGNMYRTNVNGSLSTQ